MKSRRAIVAAATAVVACGASAASASRFQLADLLGSWRSDRDRTLENWSFLPTATEAAREKIRSWFGQFIYVIGPNRIRAEFEGGGWESRYKVISRTTNVISLSLLHEERPDELTLYLEGSHFLVRVGTSSNFEYFRRIAA